MHCSRNSKGGYWIFKSECFSRTGTFSLNKHEICPDFDAYGLLRATHSHNPTEYSHIVGLSSHFYAHIGAGPKVFHQLVERKELIQAVKEARSHGDLSENFEYHAAKKAKNQNESRIRYLERMLKTAEIVEDHSKADEIGLNNTVELYCEDDDEVETYRIVTSVRGSSLNGLCQYRISNRQGVTGT